MSDRARRILAGLGLAIPVITVLAVPDYGVQVWILIVEIVMFFAGSAAYYRDKWVKYERGAQQAIKTQADVDYFRSLVPDADREHLEQTVTNLATANADLQGRLADAKIEIVTLRL